MEQGNGSQSVITILLKVIGGLAIIFIILNLAYLDLQTFTKPSLPTNNESSKTFSQTPSSQTSACSPSCLSAIEQATASSSLYPTAGTNKPSPQPTTTTSSVKEFFIPFGAGSSVATDWTDVDGLQAYVDTANYPKIKSVTFEASIHVPTGNQTAEIRLFNQTDKHPVWYSEQTYTGGSTSQLLISQPITLDGGNKLYQVQMKTQLGYTAILDQARLHILTY
jgi:hypothetical protein